MKPMKVEAGEHAPDLEALLKEAKTVEGKFGSQNADAFQSVRGVETVQPGYYWTNQQNIEVEDVKKDAPKTENVTLIEANPHDNALPAHENKAGGDPEKSPPSAFTITDYFS